MKYTESIFKNNSCNECNSNEDVRAIEFGRHNLIICKKCREKLKDLLSNEKEK
ncbi:TPA: hypothetical protein ACXDAZ_002628 [Clostridium botulinum]